MDFMRNWTFSKYGCPESRKTVHLPHDAMITEPRSKCLNGANSGYFPGGRYIYEKEFEIAPEQIGMYIALVFEGVYRCAAVFVNGEKVAYHAYGYTEFTVDISKVVKVGINTLMVDVDNSLEIRYRSVMGVELPHSPGESPAPRPEYGFADTSSLLDDCYLKFHKVEISSLQFLLIK